MKKTIINGIVIFSTLVFTVFIFSCSKINAVDDPHFDESGYLIRDSIQKNEFTATTPKKIKFYVEVSGSMNGFFRANKSTSFKTDLWAILSHYSDIAPNIAELTNNGDQGSQMTQSEFRNKMNTGGFISKASTKVPLMLETIFSNLDTNAGEVAVLISDMKYSPVGSKAPEVLLSQYSTDVSTIIGKYNKAVSLVCATSDYLDIKGNDVANHRSPYYYFIIGNGENVAQVRNVISTILEKNSNLVDNIDSGFNYGKLSYTFGIPNKCEQLEEEPTFTNYEDEDEGDTCTVKLKVDLKNYRWLVSNPNVFKEVFKIKSLYGSVVNVGEIKIDSKNITDPLLKRESVATVELNISNMCLDSEVLEWTLELPDTNISLFSEFFENAYNENDPTKSFSVHDFLRGIFQSSVVNEKLAPNYILISKNN